MGFPFQKDYFGYCVGNGLQKLRMNHKEKPGASLGVQTELEPGATSLEVQWLRDFIPMQGMQVQSLMGELRSHMPGVIKRYIFFKANIQLVSGKTQEARNVGQMTESFSLTWERGKFPWKRVRGLPSVCKKDLDVSVYGNSKSGDKWKKKIKDRN